MHHISQEKLHSFSFNNKLRNLVILATLLTLLISGFFVNNAVTHAASYCQVTYTVTNQWSGGFGGGITIQNTSGSAWSSWNLQFAFPASGQNVTQGWNGSFSQSGQNVTITNASYNGNVAANASVNPGFNGAWTTSNPVPTSFSVNGNACNGSGGITLTPGTTSTPTPGTTPTPTHGITPTPTHGTTPTSTPGNGTCTSGSAPSISYALGHRTFTYYRDGRYLPTDVWYPRTGSGGDAENAAIASGTFPLILFSHGLGSNPAGYADRGIRLLAQAGFIVAAPAYPNTKAGSSGNLGDVPNQALDASYVITQMLALNTTSGDMFNGRIRTACGIGAAGHSAGGATTHALLTIHRDNRITTAILMSAYNQGTPVGPPVKVLHTHGSSDTTVSYSGAQAMYNAYPSSWPKAFLTVIGSDHVSYMYPGGRGYTQFAATCIDWMRYGLYNDPAARNRLASDAASSVTSFTSSGL